MTGSGKATFVGAGSASRTRGSVSPRQADVFRRISSHFDRQGVFSVLDFGCGTGLLCRHIADSFPLIRIEGCDTSPDTVETARRNCLWGVFYVADADSIKLAHYDVIVARDSVVSMADVPAVIRKLDAHLYTGGRFIIACQTPAGAIREQVMRTLTELAYSVSFEELESEPTSEEPDRALRPDNYWIVSALKRSETQDNRE
jgi:trans-aconitate methyltransferase